MVKRSPPKLICSNTILFQRYINLQITFVSAYLLIDFSSINTNTVQLNLMGIPSHLQAFGLRIRWIQLLIWWWQQMEVIHPVENMNVCTKFQKTPSRSCPVLTLWWCKRQRHRFTKVIRTYALGTMNACTNVCGNLISCWGISVWTKVMDLPTDISIPTARPPVLL